MRRRPYNQMPPVQPSCPPKIPQSCPGQKDEERFEENPFDALILYPLLCRQRKDERSICELIQRLKDICPYLEPSQRHSIIRLIRLNDSLGKMGEEVAQDYALYRNEKPMTREERRRGLIRALSRTGEGRNLNNIENMMDKIFTFQSMLGGSRGSGNPLDMMSLLGPLMNIGGSNISQMMNMMSMMKNIKL